MNGRKTLINSILSIVLSLIIGAIIISAIGNDPGYVYLTLLKGAMGSVYGICESILKASTLLLTGLSFALAYKCGLTNVGAEGQLYMGALCGTFVSVNFTQMPSALHIMCALVAGVLGGAAWGALVGWLKVRFRADEIITSLMMNYIAIYIVTYMIQNPMKAAGQSAPQSEMVDLSLRLTAVIPGTRLHYGVFFALLCLIGYWIYMEHMSGGFKVRVIGQNLDCAEYLGYPLKSKMISVMAVSGAFAGLAGIMEIMGIQYRLYSNISSGYGYDGIAVALLGNCNPIGMLLSALLLGVLKNGGNNVQMYTTVPSAVVDVIQAIIIIMVVIKLFNGHLSKKNGKEVQA